MIITLPFPNKELNPNRTSGNHWAATKSLRAKAKEGAYYATKLVSNGFVSTEADYHVTINYIVPDNRVRDLDNLLAATKPQIDGIALALGMNDRLFNPITIKRVIVKNTFLMTVDIGP